MTITEQEIFDTVVRNLHAQGKPALGTNGSCQYRTAGGLKCAVGGLIPDDRYEPSMEGFRVHADKVSVALPTGMSDHIKLLSELQAAHDYKWTERNDFGEVIRITPYQFVSRLYAIATRHHLSTDVIKATFDAQQDT